jgi:beta-lysine 5,6-aminomutase beta subunit
MTAPTLEKHLIRAYGDRQDDGIIQLAFTLPVPVSEKAKEAAVLFCKSMGLTEVKVAAAERAAENYTFFIIYARCATAIDYNSIHTPELVIKKLNFDDLNRLIEEKVARRIVVLGACTGSDTHTVGIDAILNMKGYSGDPGLERYPWFEAFNLGSQVPNEELLRRAKERNADAVLVSQVVTQRDVHKDNTRQFIAEARRLGLSGKMLFLLGGPRVDHKLALELGFDGGFGPGTKPSDVANFIVHRVMQKAGKEQQGTHYEGEPT